MNAPEPLLAQPLRLSTTLSDFEAAFAKRLHWSAETDGAIEQRVADILADVRQRGDAAVLDYTARFDGLQADSLKALELTQVELRAAFDSLPAAQRQAHHGERGDPAAEAVEPEVDHLHGDEAQAGDGDKGETDHG